MILVDFDKNEFLLAGIDTGNWKASAAVAKSEMQLIIFLLMFGDMVRRYFRGTLSLLK